MILSFDRLRRNIEEQGKEEAKRLYDANNLRVFQIVLEENRADERDNVRRRLIERAKLLQQVIGEFQDNVIRPIQEDLGQLKERGKEGARCLVHSISAPPTERFLQILKTRLQDLTSTIDSLAAEDE